MEKGDISNRLPPRWLIVFEGVIGTLTPRGRIEHDFYAKARMWKRAVGAFELDDHTSKVLWDMVWRRDYKFDVVTFLPAKCAVHVEAWLEDRNVPVSNVRAYAEPAALGKQLAYLPDVYAVVHAESSNRFTYGDRGTLIDGKWYV